MKELFKSRWALKIFLGVIFILILTFNVKASIQGTVYYVEEDSNDDLFKPLNDATVKLLFKNEIFESGTNESGYFYLNFSESSNDIINLELIIKVDKDNQLPDSLEYNFLNNFTETPDINLIIIKNPTTSKNVVQPLNENKIISSETREALTEEYPEAVLHYYLPIISSKRPILLVHGWRNDVGDRNEPWGNLEDELRDQEYQVWRLEYFPANLSNRKNANIIRQAIYQILPNYQFSQLDVISHSMGGLGTRGYIQNMAISQEGFIRTYRGDIRKYVIVASPLYGSYFANIVDDITNINLPTQHIACQRLIEGNFNNCPPIIRGHDMQGVSEATSDMEIGSDYTWSLNQQPINNNVDYLAIVGKKLLNDASPLSCQYNYCLSNRMETNDGVVSLINSQLQANSIKFILVDRFHISLGPEIIPLETGIGDSRRVANLTSLFLNNQLTNYTASLILNRIGNSGELYYNPNNPFDSYPLPPQLRLNGSIIIQLHNSEIPIDDNSLKIRRTAMYPLQRNSNTGRWFYVKTNSISNQRLDFTTMLPIGVYDLLVNNRDSTKNVEIQNGRVNLIDISLDEDRDHYDLDLAGGSDCVDTNANINPIATEICNNIDDNCNTRVDETFPNLGQVCGVGIGECARQGIYVCAANATSTVCNAIPGSPTPEICDGLDNNCNGLVDDGIPDITNGTDIGECQVGIQRCINSTYQVIQQQISPTDEICNNLDDNCNNLTDENLVRQCGVNNIGLCTFGNETCSQGIWGNCNAIFPRNETCDELDNNCNGQTDESFNIGQQCSAGLGICLRNGTYICRPDQQGTQCNAMPGLPQTEICGNGIDEDCNGIDLVCPNNCTLITPETGIYDNRRLDLSVQCTEPFKKIKYTNNRNTFSTLCNNCQSYNNLKTFQEGNNHLILRSVNYNDEEQEFGNINFFTDSKDPRISKIEPTNGYTNGKLKVKYSEDNVNNITLVFDLDRFVKSDCSSGRGVECLFNINLSQYEGQQKTYYFLIEDIAGNTDSSRPEPVTVDTLPVLITNIFSPLNSQTYGRYVNLNITLNGEARYLKYIDHSTARPTYKTLCSNCNEYGFSRSKKITFSRGVHNITITAFDRAGNEDSKNMVFNVNY